MSCLVLGCVTDSLTSKPFKKSQHLKAHIYQWHDFITVCSIRSVLGRSLQLWPPWWSQTRSQGWKSPTFQRGHKCLACWLAPWSSLWWSVQLNVNHVFWSGQCVGKEKYMTASKNETQIKMKSLQKLLGGGSSKFHVWNTQTCGVLSCCCSFVCVCAPSAVCGDDLFGDSGHVPWNHHGGDVSH